MMYKNIKDYIIERSRNHTTQNVLNIGMIINNAMRTIADQRDRPFLKKKYTLNIISGQVNYVIEDQSIARIKKATRPAATTPGIDFLGIEIFNEQFGDQANWLPGEPCGLAVEKVQSFKAQPASASKITPVSDSPTADAGVPIVVTGLTSAGISARESILCGATGTISFSEILSINRGSVATGNITVTAGATTLAVIGSRDYTARYIYLKVFPIPDSSYVVELDCYKVLYDMVNDTDIPADYDDREFHDAILALALSNYIGDSAMAQNAIANDKNNKERGPQTPSLRAINRRDYRSQLYR